MIFPIARVISGGQTGADIAALRAALDAGIPTGGTLPRGWRTQAGPRPEYAARYGMTEHSSTSYGPRTFANAFAADLTVRIAADFDTAGEVLTKQACDKAKKPRVDVQLRWSDYPDVGLKIGRYCVNAVHVYDARDAIRKLSAQLGRPIVLNVAGNSERTAPGIEETAYGVVTMILNDLRSDP